MADELPEEQVHDHKIVRADQEVCLVEEQKAMEADQQRKRKSRHHCVPDFNEVLQCWRSW